MVSLDRVDKLVLGYVQQTLKKRLLQGLKATTTQLVRLLTFLVQ